MTGFKPHVCVGSDRSTNWTTTTAHSNTFRGHFGQTWSWHCLIYRLTEHNFFNINFADHWIWTMDLWYWKRPLYQLSHNHCPTIILYFHFYRWKMSFDIGEHLILLNFGNIFIGPFSTGLDKLIPFQSFSLLNSKHFRHISDKKTEPSKPLSNND